VRYISFRLLLACFLLLQLPISIIAQSVNKVPYWQQQTDYTIEVQLDDILHSLDGTEKIIYTNNSPDTLHFIWFHLWPNAYKNDQTAFSEQLLRNGRTDFYFSKEENRGYISYLSFKVNDLPADTQAHPKNIDIIKLILPQPLPPNSSATITTPFHVKLPYNFSRGGHIGSTYQIAQWYPKPAVYDSKGWHPMPYLDQGEFYSEFGSYDVKITLPENYIVAASGQLQTTTELNKLLYISNTNSTKQSNYLIYQKALLKAKGKTGVKFEKLAPKSSASTKTLHYTIENAHDFAWFASKQFLVEHDTVKLTNKVVDVFSYYPPWNEIKWKSSIQFSKNGLKFYDTHVGNYPYKTASVVSGSETIGSGGMEYPSITLITTQQGGKDLDETIAHELGHNWFYGALASNERYHAWMDEGMNSFYEKEYTKKYYPSKGKENSNFESNVELGLIKNLENIGKDQRIDLPSDSFTFINYGLFVYSKTAEKMNELKLQLGNNTFELSMKTYYSRWQFKHPYPENFKQSIEESSGKQIDSFYNSLFTTASERPRLPSPKKQLKFNSFYSLQKTNQYNHISFAPMIGYNAYDKLMVGGLIHNYQLPLNKFNFLAIPLFGTGTNTLNYFTRASYRIPLKKGWLENVSFSSSISTFTYKKVNLIDSPFEQFHLKFLKIDPAIRFNIRPKSLLSSQHQFIQLKAFFINEENVNYQSYIKDSITSYKAYKDKVKSQIFQFRYHLEDNRVLYPYDIDLTVDANENFIRGGFTSHYFFNYPEGNNRGLSIRLFAGKFIHLNGRKQYDDQRYFLNMTGPRGENDYTYSNYFVGRGDFEGINSQQLMERDGFFKVGTELQQDVSTGLSASTGTTDKWLTSINLSGNIPKAINPLEILPIKLPIKFFLDIGTYAEAWKQSNTSSRFLYDAGLQLSLFKSIVNVYVPIFYSKVYRDYYKSIYPDKSFSKSISFSIDIQKIKISQLAKGIQL